MICFQDQIWRGKDQGAVPTDSIYAYMEIITPHSPHMKWVEPSEITFTCQVDHSLYRSVIEPQHPVLKLSITLLRNPRKKVRIIPLNDVILWSIRNHLLYTYNKPVNPKFLFACLCP